jgi:hypothetical protein
MGEGIQMKWIPFNQGEIIAKKSEKKDDFFLNLLQNEQANFNQTWYTSPLGEGN